MHWNEGLSNGHRKIGKRKTENGFFLIKLKTYSYCPCKILKREPLTTGKFAWATSNTRHSRSFVQRILPLNATCTERCNKRSSFDLVLRIKQFCFSFSTSRNPNDAIFSSGGKPNILRLPPCVQCARRRCLLYPATADRLRFPVNLTAVVSVNRNITTRHKNTHKQGRKPLRTHFTCVHFFRYARHDKLFVSWSDWSRLTLYRAFESNISSRHSVSETYGFVNARTRRKTGLQPATVWR